MIHLAPGVFFDDIDGVGVLGDGHHNQYLDLTTKQTAYLAALLQSSSLEDAWQCLPTPLRADEEGQIQDLHEFMQILLSQRLVHNGPSLEQWSSHNELHAESKRCLFPETEFLDSLSSTETATSLPVWELPSLIEWEIFLTGRVLNTPHLHFSLWKRLRAAGHVLGILVLFALFTRSDWLLRAQRSFQRLRPTSLLSLPAELLQRLARREIIFSQCVMRLLAPHGRCVPRSLALCAYLRALGFPAQFVLGRARYTFGSTEFHAWVEVAGRAVNEPDELPLGYSLCVKIPLQPAEG